MSDLPPIYSSLINELNHQIRTEYPSDIVQFCSDFFLQKLSQQRMEHLRQIESFYSRSVGGGGSGMNGLGEPVGPSSATTFRRGSLAVGGFGGSQDSPRFTPPSSHKSFHPPPPLPSFPPPSTIYADPLDPLTPAHTSHHRSTISQISDPPRLAPMSASSIPKFNSTFGIESNSRLEIPPTVNLNRRQSVSAEPIDPTKPIPKHEKKFYAKTEDQVRRIKDSMSQNILFKDLTDEQSEDVINAMKEVDTVKGNPVITQGEHGEFFYIVEEGNLEVLIRETDYRTNQTKEVSKGVLKPGQTFGELALMYNAPRAATIKPLEDGKVWALDRLTFRHTILYHAARRRTTYENFLSNVEILRDLENYERAKIADALESRVFREGEEVVREGERGEEFYFVEEGRAQCWKGGEMVKELGVGDYFGGESSFSLSQILTNEDLYVELALLNDEPRAATVKPASGCTQLKVACMTKAAFFRLLGPDRLLMDRMRNHTKSYYANSHSATPVVGKRIGEAVLEEEGEGMLED